MGAQHTLQALVGILLLIPFGLYFSGILDTVSASASYGSGLHQAESVLSNLVEGVDYIVETRYDGERREDDYDHYPTKILQIAPAGQLAIFYIRDPDFITSTNAQYFKGTISSPEIRSLLEDAGCKGDGCPGYDAYEPNYAISACNFCNNNEEECKLAAEHCLCTAKMDYGSPSTTGKIGSIAGCESLKAHDVVKVKLREADGGTYNCGEMESFFYPIRVADKGEWVASYDFVLNYCYELWINGAYVTGCAPSDRGATENKEEYRDKTCVVFSVTWEMQ